MYDTSRLHIGRQWRFTQRGCCGGIFYQFQGGLHAAYRQQGVVVGPFPRHDIPRKGNFLNSLRTIGRYPVQFAGKRRESDYLTILAEFDVDGFIGLCKYFAARNQRHGAFPMVHFSELSRVEMPFRNWHIGFDVVVIFQLEQLAVEVKCNFGFRPAFSGANVVFKNAFFFLAVFLFDHAQ